MNKIEFKTSHRISVPKLFNSDLLIVIVKETDKAIRAENVVQDYGNLHLSGRWIAKSIITNMYEEEHNFEYSYDHLLNGMPAACSELIRL